MSKRIRELRQHVENKINDHERKRAALERQRDELLAILAKPVSAGFDLASKPDETVFAEVESATASHGAGGWLGVFQRLTITREGASA
ncbi:hypothetical protein D3C85_775510 [compost metagenome]